MKGGNKSLRAFYAYLVIFISAVIHGFSYHIFIFRCDFSPAGLNGIVIMIQYLTNGKFSLYWLGLLANIPLAVAAFIIADRQYALRSMFFLIIFSLTLFILEKVGFYQFEVNDAGEKFLSAVAGGLFCGLSYGAILRLSCTTGGTDFISVMINARKPQFSVIWISFAVNAAVACISYFVYGDMVAVILCIIYCFIVSKASDMVVKGFESALKLEIITDKPNNITMEIMENCNHAVTKIAVTGGYTSQDKTLIICVVTKRDLPTIKNIVQKYDGVFTYVSSVNAVYGLFNRNKRV